MQQTLQTFVVDEIGHLLPPQVSDRSIFGNRRFSITIGMDLPLLPLQFNDLSTTKMMIGCESFVWFISGAIREAMAVDSYP
jgi:hypothetical protein